MRALIVGAGSIGTRRARLLIEMGHEVYLYDQSPQRLEAAKEAGVGAPVSDWQGAKMLIRHGGADAAVFICTPAHTHVSVALDVLASRVQNLLIEKPLATSIESLEELQTAAQGKCVMVACNMRWAYFPDRPPQDVPWTGLHMTTHAPLSSWRPGAVEAYSGNGIALESAIHELDLAQFLAGPIASLHPMHFPGGALLMFAEHANGVRTFIDANWSENVRPRRDMVAGVAAMEDEVYVVPAQTLRFTPDTSDEMYRREMQHFIDCVRSGSVPCNTVNDAIHVLGWALKASEVAA